MNNIKLSPGEKFPEITVPILEGGEMNLTQIDEGYDWKLVVVYRGKHCPLCTNYLIELNETLAKFHELGVEVVAISADSHERAEQQMTEIHPDFPVGYGLSIEQMRELGLYISGVNNGIDVAAPFAEPGLFVIKEKGNLQITDISNVPFLRPEIQRVLWWINYIKNKAGDSPTNGSYRD